eukprot:631321-Rhodomonas_salina.1
MPSPERACCGTRQEAPVRALRGTCCARTTRRRPCTGLGYLLRERYEMAGTDGEYGATRTIMAGHQLEPAIVGQFHMMQECGFLYLISGCRVEGRGVGRHLAEQVGVFKPKTNYCKRKGCNETERGTTMTFWMCSRATSRPSRQNERAIPRNDENDEAPFLFREARSSERETEARRKRKTLGGSDRSAEMKRREGGGGREEEEGGRGRRRGGG